MTSSEPSRGLGWEWTKPGLERSGSGKRRRDDAASGRTAAMVLTTESPPPQSPAGRHRAAALSRQAIYPSSTRSPCRERARLRQLGLPAPADGFAVGRDVRGGDAASAPVVGRLDLHRQQLAGLGIIDTVTEPQDRTDRALVVLDDGQGHFSCRNQQVLMCDHLGDQTRGQSLG